MIGLITLAIFSAFTLWVLAGVKIGFWLDDNCDIGMLSPALMIIWILGVPIAIAVQLTLPV